MKAWVILFVGLHGICGFLTAIQLFSVAKEKRFSRYYPILALNLLHQFVSVARLITQYPTYYGGPPWLKVLEIMCSYQTVAMVVIINLSILQIFSFLFDFLQDWMLKTAFTAVYLYSGCLFAINILMFIGQCGIEPISYWSILDWIILLSNYGGCIFSVAGVIHDNVQSILILKRVYTVSKQKTDKQTLQKVQKALVITAVSTVTVIISNWLVIS
jgi:hypothetical protein